MSNDELPQISLPDKQYFKIGEVSALTGVEAYVLRFWETEFARINPMRTGSGQRLYRKSDVELILKIKYLLYEKKFTIQGAKQFLTNSNQTSSSQTPKEILKEIRVELESLRDMLSK